MAPSAESLSRRSTSGWPVELVADGGAHGAGAAAVDDPDGREPGERGVVDERPDGLARLLRALTAHVELVGDVAARGRDDPHGCLGSVALATRRGTQLRERQAQPVAGRADHFGLVALDRRDRAADAERRRLDGVAGRERPAERQRLVERAQRLLRPRGAGGRGAEPAVAVPFGANRRGRRRPPRFPLAPARHVDLLAQRSQLLARRCEVALRLGGRALALAGRRRAHGFDLGLERRLALARGRRRVVPPRRARARPHRARPRRARSAASASASSSWIRSRSGATRPRASATTAASRPSRSAIWSACDVPGRPSATR